MANHNGTWMNTWIGGDLWIWNVASLVVLVLVVAVLVRWFRRR